MAVNLDRKVQFQRSSGTDNGYGIAYVWSDHGRAISASRQDVSDSEKAVAGWVEATVVSRFLVRSSSFTRDISPTDRFTSGGRTWDIQGIKESPNGRHAFLEITARARTDV